MNAEEQRKLDQIADRLGALYQDVGRLDLPATVQSDLLDAVLALAQDVETVSGRKERAFEECH